MQLGRAYGVAGSGIWWLGTLLFASVAAAAPVSPIVGPERDFDAPVIGPSDEVKSPPVVAGSRDGNGYFAAWIDARPHDPRLGPGLYGSPPRPEYSVYGARIGKDGAVVDLGGLVIARYLTEISDVAVSGTYGSYLVVWTSGTNGKRNIVGTMVNARTGATSPSSGILISPQDGDQHSPSVACGNSDCVVVWVDESSGSGRIAGTRWTLGGPTNEPVIFPAPASGSVAADPAVAMTTKATFVDVDRTILVLWRETGLAPYGARGALFAKGSNQAGPEIVVANADVRAQSIDVAASEERGFAAVWADNGTAVSRVSRFGADGSVLDPGGLLAGAAVGVRPRIAGNSDGYSVICEAVVGAGATTVSRSLSVDGTLSSPATVTSESKDADVAMSGGGVLVGWSESPDDQTRNVYAAGLGTSGEFDAPARTLVSSRALGEQLRVLSAAGDGEYLVTYWERTGTTLKRRAVRVSAQAEPRGAPFDVPGADTIAAGGGRYLLVWKDDVANEVHGARVSADGTVLDPQGFLIRSGGGGDPCVAFDGERFLVVMGTAAAWIDGSGKVEVIDGFKTSSWGLSCALTHGRDGFLLAWDDENYEPSTSFTYRVLAARLDKDGLPASADGFQITPHPWNQRHSAIAWDGTQYLVAFQEASSGSEYVTPRFVRVTPDGVLKDPDGVPLTDPPLGDSLSLWADAVWDGSNFVVSWAARHATAAGARQGYAARVRPTGEIVDTEPIRFDYPALLDQGFGAPVLSTLGSGNCLVAYSREDVELGWTLRGKLRSLVDVRATGATCFVDDDCWSGSCVGSRCVTSTDGGSPDAMARSDAGPGDGGTDAGTPRDAAVSDRDAPDRKAPVRRHDAMHVIGATGGCGCRTKSANGHEPSKWTAFVALAFLCTRRARARGANRRSTRARCAH